MTKLSTFCFHNEQATANAAMMGLCSAAKQQGRLGTWVLAQTCENVA